MGCLVWMAGAGLVGTGKTGMDNGGCQGTAWIMKIDEQPEPERVQRGMCEEA